MTVRRRNKAPPDQSRCFLCKAPFAWNINKPCEPNVCPACAAGLFRVVEQSEVVLVPLPPATENMNS